MAGLGNIFSLFGGPNPEQDIADWSNNQQTQNRKAIGLNPDGTPAAAGAAPPDTLPPGQEPNATKTPQSLGALMMSLQRQNEADQLINQGTGAIFSGFAQPRDRERVSHIFDATQPDPLAIAKTQQDLAANQQNADRANSIAAMVNDPNQGPAIAAKLHMDWTALKAGIVANPAMVGQIAQALGTPTEKLRDVTQLPHVGGPAGQGPDGQGSTLNDVITGVWNNAAGPDNAAMNSAQTAWRLEHKGQPDSEMPWTPNSLQSFGQYAADEKAKSADRQTASGELVNKNEVALTLKSDLEELKDSPGLHSILTTPGKRDIALSALKDPTATDIPSMMKRWALSNEEAKAVALLRRIGGATTEEAMKSMAGTGTRVTQQEVGPLKDAVLLTQNLNQSYEDYVHGAINNALTKTKRTVAANYGNTGNVKNMDPEFAPWLNPAFKKGGQLWKEGSGADDVPAAGPVPAQEVSDAKELLADKPYLKDELLDTWQQRGFDTSKFRTKNPAKW